MIPIAVYVAMFFVDWKLALLSLASIPISLIAMMTMYSVGMKKMGPYYMAGQKMNNTIIEYINGMEVVKVFNKDADSYERFRKDVSDYRDYTLAWYKAAWPWMAIYSSLLPCTIILTLPVGAWFVLSGWSTLPNLILVLCLSLSIGMPLLKSLGFLPTMPQLNYKISALEQVLDAPELQQTEDAFHGKDDTITYDHVSFAYQTTQPGPDGKPVVIEDEVLHDISFTDVYKRQLLFCFNDGVSWNIADARQSVSIQKGESCIYRGHGKMEYLCYSGKKDFLFKNIKIPMPYFHKILNDYFEDSEINAYERCV